MSSRQTPTEPATVRVVVADLLDRVARLEERANKISRTSSKPVRRTRLARRRARRAARQSAPAGGNRGTRGMGVCRTGSVGTCPSTIFRASQLNCTLPAAP